MNQKGFRFFSGSFDDYSEHTHITHFEMIYNDDDDDDRYMTTTDNDLFGKIFQI